MVASKFKMLDGREMPALALGTCLGLEESGFAKPKNKELRDLVLKAIDEGYRHVDTAYVYNTEEEVGEAINMKIAEGIITREDFFITTKLWNHSHKREQVLPAVKASLKNLGLDYIDLYLIHWPVATDEAYALSDIDFMETWRGMEDICKLGLAKSIGVANFNKKQMLRLLAEAEIKPAVLQIEVHPQLIQTELLDFCKSEGIIVQGYCPLGSLVSREGRELNGPTVNDSTFTALAKKYGKTPIQIVLRWAVDRGVVPLPKTMNPNRLAGNLNIFDFKLDPEDIKKINHFNSETRFCLPSFWQDSLYYPFEKVENPMKNIFKI